MRDTAQAFSSPQTGTNLGHHGLKRRGSLWDECENFARLQEKIQKPQTGWSRGSDWASAEFPSHDTFDPESINSSMSWGRYEAEAPVGFFTETSMLENDPRIKKLMFALQHLACSSRVDIKFLMECMNLAWSWVGCCEQKSMIVNRLICVCYWNLNHITFRIKNSCPTFSPLFYNYNL